MDADRREAGRISGPTTTEPAPEIARAFQTEDGSEGQQGVGADHADPLGCVGPERQQKLRHEKDKPCEGPSAEPRMPAVAPRPPNGRRDHGEQQPHDTESRHDGGRVEPHRGYYPQRGSRVQCDTGRSIITVNSVLAFSFRPPYYRALAGVSGAVLVGASALVLASGTGSGESDGWRLVSNEHAIAIYRRDVPGSGIVALKGEGMIDAPDCGRWLRSCWIRDERLNGSMTSPSPASS